MKILLVSYFFPPFNTIGAVRSGKLAKYWLAHGHDVRVLTARDQLLPPTLHLEIPGQRVTATRWFDVNMAARWRPTLSASTPSTAAAGPGRPSLLRSAFQIYKHLVNFPDPHIGWLPFALRAGRALMRDWRPDLIYASASPFTSFLVAHGLSQAGAIPWVAEYRDLWTGDPYLPDGGWRRRIEARLERRVVGGAAGLVTVSEPLAASLEATFATPTAVILNGFDRGDYPAEPGQADASDVLRIVYTGPYNYQGRRDPAALFEALRLLGPAADRIRVQFYGHGLAEFARIAERHGVSRNVEFLAPVPYQAALAIQARADMLLLLLWNDPRERGTYSGKLFEYIGARRPILALGLEDGVACTLIRERQAGFVANDPANIARHLERCLEEKLARGRLAPIPESAGRGLGREDQARRVEVFLEGLLGAVDRVT